MKHYLMPEAEALHIRSERVLFYSTESGFEPIDSEDEELESSINGGSEGSDSPASELLP